MKKTIKEEGAGFLSCVFGFSEKNISKYEIQ